MPGSSEVFVESAARQPVWASEVSQRIDVREVASAEAMDRARAALGRAVATGGLVLLEGADVAGVSALLQQVASGVERDVSPLIIGGEPLLPDAFARRVLEAVGHTPGDAPRRVLEHYADALVARGAALLLLVDAADSLPAETVRWLAALTCGATPRSRVVLAATDHQAFLESLAGLGSCVDLVRLETDSRVSFSVPLSGADAGADVDDDHEVAVVPWSQAETTGSPDPTLCESTWNTTNEPEDREADEPPQSATPDDHLHTIEELLGEGDWTVPAQSDPVSAAVPRDRPAAEPASEPEPLFVEAVPPPSMPEPERSSDPSPEPMPPIVVGIADADAAPREAPGAPSPARTRRPALLLISVVFGLALSFALFETRPEFEASMPSPAASVSDRGARRQVSRPLAPETPSLAPDAVPVRAMAATPTNDVELGVTDLRGAIDLLASPQDEPTWERARRFLREHGPDAEGLDLLDALAARRSSGPLQAVALLEARSRVRAALCAAWADDPRGGTPAQLGCPG